MCGIVGYISANNHGFTVDERDFVSDMLYMDALRGWDATGCFYMTNKGDVQVHKEASPAPVFMSSPEWLSTRGELFGSGRWFVGHNRAATRGEKVDKNAHPFVVDNVVLVQNGTMAGSHHHLAAVEVDSHACAHVIAENPDDISAALKQIDASYAFIWWDHKKETLFVIRNTERPLYIGYTATVGIAFASEWGIMEAAASRNDIAFRKVDGEVQPPYLIKDGQLCAFAFKDGKLVSETYTDIDIAPKRRFVQAPFHHGQAGRGTTVSKQPGGTWQPTKPAQNKPAVFGALDAYAFTFPADEDYLLGEAEFQGLLAISQKLPADQRKVLIDGLDYCCVSPNDPNCDQYYIFGAIVDPDGPLNGYHVFWTIEAPSTEAVVDYVTKNIFTGKIKTPTARRLSHGVWRALLGVTEIASTNLNAHAEEAH